MEMFLEKARQVPEEAEQDPLTVDAQTVPDDELVENFDALTEFMKDNILNHQCKKHRKAFGHCWKCCRVN